MLLGFVIDGTEFPLFERIFHSGFKAAVLFFLRNRKPEFDDFDAILIQHVLKLRDLLHEYLVLFLGAKLVDGFDDRPVIPTAVKKCDFPRVG